jgi:heat shock protein HspQ
VAAIFSTSNRYKNLAQMNRAAFSIGQIVHHKLFDYRGVIYDVDPVFQGTEEWYGSMARTRPPKNKPWYHILVDGQMIETYVAERNLEPDETDKPIEHPLIDNFFREFKGGVYALKVDKN